MTRGRSKLPEWELAPPEEAGGATLAISQLGLREGGEGARSNLGDIGVGAPGAAGWLGWAGPAPPKTFDYVVTFLT